MKTSFALLSGASIVALTCSVQAENLDLSVQTILSSMNAAGGSEAIQWQVAPSYSELFGFGVRTTVGGYLSETVALGVIIDYGQHREEYLANAGLQLNANTRVVGSFGLLKESEEFTPGEGREDVQQFEYGLSLKGHYDAGPIRGYEINAYRTDASGDADSIETGDLTGLQAVTTLKPSEGADLRLGVGYERAEWEGGDIDEGFTLQAIGSLQVSDTLSLNYAAKSAETENTFGLGLTYDLSNATMRNSSLSISFKEIQGKHGITDDTRLAINWTMGLGGAASAGTDIPLDAMSSVTRKDLLADVMTRPAFLPERVLARAAQSCLPLQVSATANINNFAPQDVLVLDPMPPGLVENQEFSLTVNQSTRNWTYASLTVRGVPWGNLFQSYTDANGDFSVFDVGDIVTVRYVTAEGVCYEGSTTALLDGETNSG